MYRGTARVWGFILHVCSTHGLVRCDGEPVAIRYCRCIRDPRSNHILQAAHIIMVLQSVRVRIEVRKMGLLAVERGDHVVVNPSSNFVCLGVDGDEAGLEAFVQVAHQRQPV